MSCWISCDHNRVRRRGLGRKCVSTVGNIATNWFRDGVLPSFVHILAATRGGSWCNECHDHLALTGFQRSRTRGRQLCSGYTVRCIFILAHSQVLFEHHYFENDVNLDGLRRISRVYVRDVKRSARLVCCDSACLLLACLHWVPRCCCFCCCTYGTQFIVDKVMMDDEMLCNLLNTCIQTYKQSGCLAKEGWENEGHVWSLVALCTEWICAPGGKEQCAHFN